MPIVFAVIRLCISARFLAVFSETCPVVDGLVVKFYELSFQCVDMCRVFKLRSGVPVFAVCGHVQSVYFIKLSSGVPIVFTVRGHWTCAERFRAQVYQLFLQCADVC